MMRDTDHTELRLWCLLDGKPGHQNQTIGLADAINRLCHGKVVVTEIQVPKYYPAKLLGPAWPACRLDERPDLIIGAGHSTHWALLTAKYRFGGKAIVLMKPSIPMQFFDLCVVPDSHNIRKDHAKVILTRGVLNRIIPSDSRDEKKALILLGGPSQHFDWCDEDVYNQLEQVIYANRNLQWTIATSRRTPAHFFKECKRRQLPAKIVDHVSVDQTWLPDEIQASHVIWVTEDSVSMTYEAVTSGATVGTLQLPRSRETRVTLGMKRLIESGCVTPWKQWKATGQYQSSNVRLFEAERIAREVLFRFAPDALFDINQEFAGTS